MCKINNDRLFMENKQVLFFLKASNKVGSHQFLLRSLEGFCPWASAVYSKQTTIL